MSTKIEVNAMGDACPLPVVKTLKALKQLDGEGAVVTSVDNETAVKNISKMAQEKGCTASVEKVSDAEWQATMLFYNGGAKLTVEGSPVLDDLKGLAEQGVEILTCGTCLDHYGIKDQLAVGEVTNMYVIVEKMEQAVRVVRP